MSYPLQLLIIDDDIHQCQTLADILILQGFAVDTVHSGAEAYSFFEKSTYDLAIVDIRLGDISGPELVKRISDRFPGTEFIYITGFASLETAVVAVQQKQVISYEEKPIQIERILSFANQIIRRKEVERGLNVSEERFSKLTAMSPTGIYETDKHGKLIYVNHRWCQVTGVKEEDAIGTTCLLGVHECDRVGCENTWKRILAGTDNLLKHEFRFKHNESGKIVWIYDEAQPVIDNEGGVTSYIGTRIDITDRRVKEKALLDHRDELDKLVQERTLILQNVLREKEIAQESLNSVFQSIPDGVISVDTNLCVLEKNAFCLPGIDPELTVGRKIDPTKNQLQAELHKALQHSFASLQVIKEMRVEYQGKGEGIFTLVLNTALMRDDKGIVNGALLIARDITQLAELESVVEGQRKLHRLIGKSAGLQHVFKMIRLLADKETSVLVTGESGTGKELVVQSLHDLSHRKSMRLVKVNCSALPENLLESELFGHVRGSFTGAIQDRSGRVEAAEGGTLFLDEIGDISLAMQVKLLRFIESKEYERVGESRTRLADIRIIAATNVDLEKKIKQEQFRKDFYYRLKVVTIHLPALRQRTEDIPLLMKHFMRNFGRQLKKDVNTISPDVLHFCMGYHWPGNIRELKHVIEHACILVSGNRIEMKHLPIESWQMATTDPPQPPPPSADKKTLVTVLQQTDWNVAKAARLLRIGRTTIYQRIKRYGIIRNQT